MLCLYIFLQYYKYYILNRYIILLLCRIVVRPLNQQCLKCNCINIDVCKLLLSLSCVEYGLIYNTLMYKCCFKNVTKAILTKCLFFTFCLFILAFRFKWGVINKTSLILRTKVQNYVLFVFLWVKILENLFKKNYVKIIQYINKYLYTYKHR